MKHITLDSLRFANSEYISMDAYQSSYFANMKVNLHKLENSIQATMYVDIAAATTKGKTVIYPKDWWEAFKHRWAPKWVLKISPVIYKVVTFKPYLLFPSIGYVRPEPAGMVIVEKEKLCFGDCEISEIIKEEDIVDLSVTKDEIEIFD